MTYNLQRNAVRIGFAIVLLLLLAPTLAKSQSADTLLSRPADSVLVVAARLPTPQARLPYSLSQLSKQLMQRGRQQWSMAEPLNRLPGLLVLNPNNFAQDLRLSVRGFGARAAFGIRGLRLMVDGLPESTPDGQGQVDNLDAGLLEKVELLRGPASSLYGNAAGGVLRFKTEDPPLQAFAEGRASGGSFGFQRYQVKTGAAAGPYAWLVYGSHTQAEGYRANSRMRSTLFNGKVQRSLPRAGKLSLLLNFVRSPQAQDPGGLTDSLAQAAPAAAWAGNERFEAGEQLWQGRAGLRWEQPLGAGKHLEATAFYLRRDFENRLPFESGGAVKLQRDFYGGRFQYRWRSRLGGRPYRSALGLSVERQEDGRRRFDNLSGQRGQKVFDQLEVFSALGSFWLQEWSPFDGFWLNAGLRLDFNQLEARDFFQQDGDDSGQRRYQTWSPSLGSSFQWAEGQFIYGNYSFSFETPALSELSANPGGSGGFNPNLEPQRAYNFEVGAKGKAAASLRYQLSFFYIRLQSELLPYELPAQPGRLFYRNAGRSRRLGLETALEWQPENRWSAFITYTYGHYTYRAYERGGEDFSGKRLPGIPPHRGVAELAYQFGIGGLAVVEARYLDDLFADDANQVKADGFLDLQLRVSQKWSWRTGVLEVFGGINNLLNARYSNNVRINAFGGRYFEPAPGRNIYGGFRYRWKEPG